MRIRIESWKGGIKDSIPNSALMAVAVLAFMTPLSCFSQGKELELKWEYRTPWLTPQAVVQDQGDAELLHVAFKGGGVRTIRMQENGTRPTDIATIQVQQLENLQAMNLYLDGETLYVALGDLFKGNSLPGMAAISVADPANPEVLSVWKSKQRPGEFHRGSASLLVDDGIAYLAAMSGGVVMFDVSRPDAIRELQTIYPDKNYPIADPNSIQRPNARGLAIKDNYLYIAFDAGGLRVIDISDRKRPVEKWKYLNKKLLHRQQAYNNLTIHGDRAFVAVDYGGMEILDISEPSNIRQIAWWNPWDAHTNDNTWLNSPGHTNQIHFDAERKLVFMSAGDSELLVVNVSNENVPKQVAQFGEPRNRQGAWGVGFSPDFRTAYVSYINALVPFHSGWSGVRGIDTSEIHPGR